MIQERIIVNITATLIQTGTSKTARKGNEKWNKSMKIFKALLNRACRRGIDKLENTYIKKKKLKR